jgi:hypothetical protein
MATRYKCRVFYVELPDGRIQVTDTVPGDQFDIARRMYIIGPAPVVLPELPQTKREHDDWLRDLISDGYVEMATSDVPDDDEPAVEVVEPDTRKWVDLPRELFEDE